MRRRWGLLPLLSLLLLCSQVSVARADDAGDLIAWLVMQGGPSVAPMLSLGMLPGRFEPGFMVHFGLLAGLPVQLDGSLDVVPLPKAPTAINGSFGLRVLPFGWKANHGPAWSDGPGHSVGFVAGYGTLGGYVGVTYEWFFHENMGTVFDLTVPIGGAPDSQGAPRAVLLNIGFKLQRPFGVGDD